MRCLAIGLIPGVATQASARNGFAEPGDRTPKIAAISTPPSAETARSSFEPRKTPQIAAYSSDTGKRRFVEECVVGRRFEPGNGGIKIRAIGNPAVLQPRAPIPLRLGACRADTGGRARRSVQTRCGSRRRHLHPACKRTSPSSSPEQAEGCGAVRRALLCCGCHRVGAREATCNSRKVKKKLVPKSSSLLRRENSPVL